jgi:hypothetical protein
MDDVILLSTRICGFTTHWSWDRELYAYRVFQMGNPGSPQLHHQRLCGGIIPVFGLQGYVSEYLFTVTILLIDRSLGNSGLRWNNFLLFASNPNSGIRAGSMRSMLVRLEHTVLMWALTVLLLSFTCNYSYLWHCWIASGLANRPYASARLVPHLTYDLYRTRGLGEVSDSPL